MNAPISSRHVRPAALVSVIFLLVACGSGNPTASVPSPSPASASATPSAPPTPSPVVLAQLPTGRVVFDELRGGPEGNLLGTFVLGADGTRAAVEVPVSSEFLGGVFSPGGDRLLVSVYTGERLLVGTLDLATGAFAEIKPEGMTGEIECSDWTPDARRVICQRGGPDAADDGIYSVDVASGAATRLTTSAFHHVVGTSGECGGGEGRAVFSADGSRFAFIQQQCGAGANPSDDENGALAVASADGSNIKVLVPFGGPRTHPGGEISWSPTDDLIAFATQNGTLSVINADGSGLRDIALPMPGFSYGPTWSPDGKWLLVTVVLTATSTPDLFLVAADGTEMLQLTDSPETEAYTDWADVP